MWTLLKTCVEMDEVLTDDVIQKDYTRYAIEEGEDGIEYVVHVSLTMIG